MQKAIEQARAIFATQGAESQACAAAWDAVEELQAEASHQKAEKGVKTPLQAYCEANPDAAECRIYED
ncbi:MAG: CP12 domain-containing protein [Microcystaceae cyanobacterium]